MTLKYNIGLTLEQLGRIEEAEALYRSVVSKTPEYSDAFLRLGLMSQERGQLNEAEDFLLDASRNDARSLKALLLQVLFVCLEWKVLLLHIGEFEVIKRRKEASAGEVQSSGS